nr:MAG TPA: regulatory protein [Caudoviricetes sp.]
MNNLSVINDVKVEFNIVGEEVFTDTLKIAEVFEKNHHNVLRLISRLPKDDFFRRNFKENSYLNKQNKSQPYYNLTRDGFSLLIMGFTGEKAYKWKTDYIKAFNLMFQELQATKIKLLEEKGNERYREIYDLRSRLKNERRMSEARYEAISDLKKRLDKNTTPELEELRSRARFLEEELERIKKQIPNGDDLNYYYSLESKVEALQQELNEKEHENFDLQSEKFGYMQGQGKIINDIVAKLETIYAANKTVQDELFYYISALKKNANKPIKYHQLPTIKVKK